jgi:predicted AAA+ superfamily ATPase
MEKRIIKQILLEQKREIKEIFRGKIIPREEEAKIKKTIKTNLIKVITGIRRSGKSVLAHRLLKEKNYGYINFDDERLLDVKAKDLNDFLEVLKEINPNFKYLLLDEIQNVEGWELFVNRLKRMNYNLIITGSNSRLLSKELATHLTGRHITIELFPFSFQEFLTYKKFKYNQESFYLAEERGKIKRLFNQYLKYGGFPELLKIETKNQYLRDLYDKILVQDIILRFNIKYIRDLKEIALYLISNFASRISYNKIKNIFGMKSVHTVKNYINYIEEAYLIFQIYPFSFKLKNQLLQSKKIYVIDSGFINIIIPRIAPDYGKLMENLVLIQLLRKKDEVYFYLDYQGREVDFVIKEGLKIKQLIQVCYDIENYETKKREIRSLLAANNELKCKNLLIITQDIEGEEKVKGKKIKFIPLWKWLLE